ncbi:hypothetical protein HYDPIDRAFT_168434 [Hydnomerulius pinastri MD-312]|uniref:Uncharacterized protein n=1 Tax=Hydnomerulius pinastri MD-312 TaxID=994086 RepID=A0A0C9W879_9AGAM|nr:hypothetical protein HYDPIDRAFT_168434 [Hydnomerulius pinastri MD-312]
MRRFLSSSSTKDSSSFVPTTSNSKGKQRQRDRGAGSFDVSTASTSTPGYTSLPNTMEVHVSTEREIHSTEGYGHGSGGDEEGFQRLGSTSTLGDGSTAYLAVRGASQPHLAFPGTSPASAAASSSSLRPSPTPSLAASASSRPLPPGIRVPTHPYPYWHSHTPSSSSQSSLESPATTSHVNWISGGNAGAAPTASSSTPYLPPSSSSSTGPSMHPSPNPHASSSSKSLPLPILPYFPPPPTSPPPETAAPAVSARPRIIHPSKSTHSLRVPVQEYYGAPLSPIVEQEYMSPEKRCVSLVSEGGSGSAARTSTGGTRESTALTARTSPVSPGLASPGGVSVTPVSAVPISPVLVQAAGGTPRMQGQGMQGGQGMQTPVTPSYAGGVVPFSRRRDEEGGDSPRPSPVFSTFLSRPLNRSISLSSTRTHQSSGSSAGRTPPVIPPLDLRPEFRGQAFLTTPTSLSSRGMLDVTYGYGEGDDESVDEAGRRESFVTARTGAGRESRYSLAPEGPEEEEGGGEGGQRDSGGTVHPFDGTPHAHPHDLSKPRKPPLPPRPTMAHPRSASRTSSYPPSYNYPPGAHEYHHPHAHTHYNPHPLSHANDYYHPHRPSPSPHPGVSAPSLHSLGSVPSTSSSFVDRRFAESSLYLTPSSERFPAAHKEPKRTFDTIQVLFWVGFIAPWCWLIGGWLISPSSSSSSRYGGGALGRVRGGSSLLPLWTGKSMQSFDTVKMQHGYPFVAPSVLSLTPPSYNRVVLTPKPARGARNPWVWRCRVAACTSGVVIVVAFVVALVVVGMGAV